MTAVTITQITYPELEGLIETSLRKILSGKSIEQNSGTSQNRKVLNVDQAIEITHLSKSRLYVLAGNGIIPNFKRGNRILFYEDELLKWVESGKRFSQDEINQAADEALLKETA